MEEIATVLSSASVPQHPIALCSEVEVFADFVPHKDAQEIRRFCKGFRTAYSHANYDNCRRNMCGLSILLSKIERESTVKKIWEKADNLGAQCNTMCRQFNTFL